MPNLHDLVIHLGTLGIFATIILETGTPIGVFLPGDSLLFGTGLLASKGFFSLWHILPLFFIGGVIGNELGYYVGKKYGVGIFTEESKYFKPVYLEKTHAFIEKYGIKAVIIGRFVPIVRTIISNVAGIGGMNHRTFFLCNVLGSVVWAIGLPLLGFMLGERIGNIEYYILPLSLVIILLSFLPVIREWMKHRKKEKTSV